MPSSCQPSIAQYYAGKTVAITGGTGFLGQCVIEKLLRTCPDVRKILLLLRKKKNQSVSERLSKFVELPIFDKLRSLQCDFERKIIPVCANLEENGLGLSVDSIEYIQNEVNIFIHSAATLRFDEHLRLAFQVNTLAVRSIIKLCRGIRNLEVLVHISTAYSYCNRKTVGEEIYQTGWDFDKLHDAMQWMTDDMITKLTPDILRDRPNTYTLTKAFGEEVIVNEGEGLPVCIVRPSIIGASLEEPLPGWCSNLNGATGLIVAYGKGLLHSLYISKNLNLDIIPADFVVNGVIAAGWRTGSAHTRCSMSPRLSLTKSDLEETELGLSKVDSVARSMNCIPEADTQLAHKRRKTIPIYHLVVGEKSPVRAKQWGDFLLDAVYTYPFEKVFQAPSLYFAPNKFIFRFQSFIMQYIPAYIFDLGMAVFGHKPMLMRYNQRVAENVNVLQFFISNQWIWESKSVDAMFQALSDEDKKVFSTTAYSINWSAYVKRYVIGSKRYVLKEDPQGLPAARRHLWRIRVLGYCFQGLLLMVLWRLLVSRTAIARNLWHLFMSLLFKFFNFCQLSSTVHKKGFFPLWS